MGKGKTPEVPDYAEAARQGVYADLENYPFRYLVDAAAQTGGSYTDPSTGQVYDFTGMGNAETAGKVSDKMAQAMLDIQRSHSSQFIQQRLAELKASDPQGYAARQQLFDRIMAEAEKNPDRPLAENLQREITDTLNKGGKLDARGEEQVREGVRGGQIERGIILGNAPTAQEASAQVQASDQMLTQRQQQALQFLQSGVSPEDVAYRRMQQNIGNLGDFTAGKTPSAQFGDLSSAGNGAAPFVGGGGSNVSLNPNAAATGANWASNIYSGQVNWANNQVNPYMAGISSGLGVYNAATALGYGRTTPNTNPFNVQATSPTTYQSGGQTYLYNE